MYQDKKGELSSEDELHDQKRRVVPYCFVSLIEFINKTTQTMFDLQNKTQHVRWTTDEDPRQINEVEALNEPVHWGESNPGRFHGPLEDTEESPAARVNKHNTSPKNLIKFVIGYRVPLWQPEGNDDALRHTAESVRCDVVLGHRVPKTNAGKFNNIRGGAVA